MDEQTQVPHGQVPQIGTKIKEVVRELRDEFGIRTSPEEVLAFGLGMGVRGEWTHSKKEMIKKYFSEIYGEISTPKSDLYKLYMSKQKRPKNTEVPKWLK